MSGLYCSLVRGVEDKYDTIIHEGQALTIMSALTKII